MRKSILFALIFVVLISIGYSQAPWHSNIHLNRLKVVVDAYLPYNYSDRVEEIYNERPTELIVTVPVMIDTRALGIFNCSEIYIFSLNDNNFVYFYTTETGDFACGTHSTYFYIRMKMKFIGKDPALGMEVWKNTIYLYFNPAIPLSTIYLNFSRAFSKYIDFNGFGLTFLYFGYEEPSYDQYRYNYLGGFPRYDVKIETGAPIFSGFFYSFLLKPKLQGLGTLYFSASNIDDYLVVCTQRYPNSVSTNCMDKIIDSTQNILSGSYMFKFLDAVPFIVYLKNNAGGAGFNLYIKHEDWDTYREIKIDDPTIQSYYEIGSMAGYDPVSNKDIPFPAGYYIADYDINYVELNTNYIAQNYKYVIEITIDTTSLYDPLFFNFEDGQIYFSLDTKSLISNGYLDSQCSNILFVFEDKTVRYFWFDKEYCNNPETLFFVRIPNIPPGNIKKLYMYMSSNPISYNNFYNPYITFTWFVDFNSLSDVYLTFDTSGAEYYNERYFNVSGGKLYVYPSDRGTTLKRKVYYPEYGFVTRVGAEPFTGIRALFAGTGYEVRYDGNGWFSGYDPTGHITTFFWMNMFYHEIQTMIKPEIAFRSVGGYLFVDYLHYYFRAMNETTMNEVYLGYLSYLGFYPSITHQIGPLYTADISGLFYFEYFGFFTPKPVNASIYVGTPIIYVPPAVCWIAADHTLDPDPYIRVYSYPEVYATVQIDSEIYSTPVEVYKPAGVYRVAIYPPPGYEIHGCDFMYCPYTQFPVCELNYAEAYVDLTQGDCRIGIYFGTSTAPPPAPVIPNVSVNVYTWEAGEWKYYGTFTTPFNITVDCNRYWKITATPPSGYSFYDVNYTNGVYFASIGASYAELQANVTKGLNIKYILKNVTGVYSLGIQAFDINTGMPMNITVYVESHDYYTTPVNLFLRPRTYEVSGYAPPGTGYRIVSVSCEGIDCTLTSTLLEYIYTVKVNLVNDGFVRFFLQYYPIYDWVYYRTIDKVTGAEVPSIIEIDGVNYTTPVNITYLRWTYTCNKVFPPSGYIVDGYIAFDTFNTATFDFPGLLGFCGNVVGSGDVNFTLRRLTEAPPIYFIYLNATDQYGRFVLTNVYINGNKYSTGTTITLYNETYSISVDIPANYSFVRWESKYGNVVISNPYSLATTIKVNGNDTLTLVLSYTPPPPPVKYRVYCYIYTTGGQDVEDAFLIIGGMGCPHEAYLDLDAGTYSLDVNFDTSKYSFNRYAYSGNIYIPNIYSKTTSVTVNGNGTITAYLSTITTPTPPPTPPPTANITLPSVPFVNYFGIDKFLVLILILVVGGILAIENIIIGAAFVLSGLILTFLGIDAVSVVIILFSLIVSYAIIKFFRR